MKWQATPPPIVGILWYPQAVNVVADADFAESSRCPFGGFRVNLLDH